MKNSQDRLNAENSRPTAETQNNSSAPKRPFDPRDCYEQKSELTPYVDVHVSWLAGSQTWSEWEIFCAACSALSLCRDQVRAAAFARNAPDDMTVELIEVLQIADRTSVWWINRQCPESVKFPGDGLKAFTSFSIRVVISQVLWAIYVYRDVLERAARTDAEREFIMLEMLVWVEAWASTEGSAIDKDKQDRRIQAAYRAYARLLRERYLATPNDEPTPRPRQAAGRGKAGGVKSVRTGELKGAAR